MRPSAAIVWLFEGVWVPALEARHRRPAKQNILSGGVGQAVAAYPNRALRDSRGDGMSSEGG